jgi:2-iminobutanoate/2-iminopropanoate deaminase
VRESISIPGFSHKNPVSTACKKANIVVSGALGGVDPETGILPETFAEQSRNLFIHIRNIVEAAGGSVDDIVKVEVWLENMSDREAVNEEWVKLFPDPASRPTRHAFPGAGAFGKGMLIVGNMMAVLEQ